MLVLKVPLIMSWKEQLLEWEFVWAKKPILSFLADIWSLMKAAVFFHETGFLFFSLHKEAVQGEPGALGAHWMLGFFCPKKLSGLGGYFNLKKYPFSPETEDDVNSPFSGRRCMVSSTCPTTSADPVPRLGDL